MLYPFKTATRLTTPTPKSLNKTLLPAATKLWSRLCFYSCLILLTGEGCAIPACIAGGIPACLAAGLQRGCAIPTCIAGGIPACLAAGLQRGCAIPTCIAGGIPACLVAGLRGMLSQHALQEVSQHALQQVLRGAIPACLAAGLGGVPGRGGEPAPGGPSALVAFWFGGILVQNDLLVCRPSG